MNRKKPAVSTRIHANKAYNFHAMHDKWKREREIRYRRSQAVKSLLTQKGEEVFKKFQVNKVVLYGSVLEYNMREHSDIDILVDYLPPEIFFAFQCQLEELLNVPVDVHTMDEDEKFTRKVLERGEIIYEV
jgi:predicted nucleotidyltransferase